MTSGGCLFQKSPQVQVPVATPPAPLPAPAPAEQTPPPPVATTPPTPSPAPATPPPEPAKPSPFPSSTTPTNPPPARAAAPTPTRPQTPAPSLGVVLSAQQKIQLENAYKADTATANSLATQLGKRGLTAEQLDSLGRARALLKQSAQYHDRDLTTSAELARRAKVLLQDLNAALK